MRSTIRTNRCRARHNQQQQPPLTNRRGLSNQRGPYHSYFGEISTACIERWISPSALIAAMFLRSRLLRCFGLRSSSTIRSIGQNLDLRSPVHDYFDPLFATRWTVPQLNPHD